VLLGSAPVKAARKQVDEIDPYFPLSLSLSHTHTLTLLLFRSSLPLSQALTHLYLSLIGTHASIIISLSLSFSHTHTYPSHLIYKTHTKTTHTYIHTMHTLLAPSHSYANLSQLHNAHIPLLLFLLLSLSLSLSNSLSPKYLRAAFTTVAPKSVRIQSSCRYLLCFLGSTGEKAAHRMLMKLTLDLTLTCAHKYWP